jgi:hypothetical protein
MEYRNIIAIEKLIAAEIDLQRFHFAAEEIGITIEFDTVNNMRLIEVAMDIIGYPSQEIWPAAREYFQDELFELLEQKPGKKQIHEFAIRLFQELDELILEKPELFVVKPPKKKDNP